MQLNPITMINNNISPETTADHYETRYPALAMHTI